MLKELYFCSMATALVGFWQILFTVIFMESIKMVDGRRESVDRWKVGEWKWTEFGGSLNLNIDLNAISGPY